MDRMQWLERSLQVLARHHQTPAVVVQFDPQLRHLELIEPRHGKVIGAGETLADAVESGIRTLSDEELLKAGGR